MEDRDILFITVRGPAKTETEWYRSLPESQQSSWAELQRALRARFASHNQDVELATKLTRIRQREGATVSDYAMEFETTLGHLRRYDAECFSEFMQTQLFVMGLGTHQQTYVRALLPKTLHQAIELAVSILEQTGTRRKLERPRLAGSTSDEKILLRKEMEGVEYDEAPRESMNET